MSKAEYPPCAYCNEPVQPHERKTACDACMLWHHQECWEALDRCAACDADDQVGDEDEAPAKPAGGEKRREPRPKKKEQLPVPMPKGIALEETGSGLVLTHRWFQPMFIFLVFFCLMWDGFLFVFIAAIVGGGAPAVMLLFLSLHLAVGVGLTYYTVCGFVNRSEVRVEGDRLTIQHRPLPWRGNRDLDTSSLEQLFCQQKTHRGKHGSISYSYELHAVTSDGKQIKLLSGLQEANQARFVEQQIEGHLGIEDRSVPGEMNK